MSVRTAGWDSNPCLSGNATDQLRKLEPACRLLPSSLLDPCAGPLAPSRSGPTLRSIRPSQSPLSHQNPKSSQVLRDHVDSALNPLQFFCASPRLRREPRPLFCSTIGALIRRYPPLGLALQALPLLSLEVRLLLEELQLDRRLLPLAADGTTPPPSA